MIYEEDDSCSGASLEEVDFKLHYEGFSSHIIAVYFNKKYGGKKFIHVNDHLYYYNDIYWEHDSKHIMLNKFITNQFVPDILKIISNLKMSLLNRIKNYESNYNNDDNTEFEETTSTKSKRSIYDLNQTD